MKRLLKKKEIEVAWDVYSDTLPYDKIYISSSIGLGKRQFTTPGLKRNSGWVLHMGSAWYQSAGAEHKDRWIFIHELMHVWQSINAPHKWSYVADSVCQQIVLLKGKHAYDYTIGTPWEQLHAEQQAQLVSDWYQLGQSFDDDRYQYISNYVLKGKKQSLAWFKG